MNDRVRILLVEDSAFQRKCLRLQLEAQSYEVREAATGEEAELEMHRSLPDAVLLDWDLPDIQGPELLLRWSRDPDLRWIPVLMVTSHGDPESLLHALDSGAVDFLRKPPERIELVARLRTALRIKALQAQLRELSVRDPLTSLYNRRHFDERLLAEAERARRYGRPFSCVLLDIDHFKQINDLHGHDMGDLVLRQMGVSLHEGVRQSDLVARYGGEEFVLLLPETPHPVALMCIERLNRTLALAVWGTPETPLRVTCSGGVATYPGAGLSSPEALLKAADAALYAAKAAGRNCVVSAETGAVAAAPAAAEAAVETAAREASRRGSGTPRVRPVSRGAGEA
jgi:two-component system, cell cycle response regulator